MRRVVVTGMGVVSCLGNTLAAVSAALRDSRSGIRVVPAFVEMGLRSHVAGAPQIDLTAEIDRKLKRFMGDAAAYAYVSMRDAMADAGLDGPGRRRGRADLRADRHQEPGATRPRSRRAPCQSRQPPRHPVTQGHYASPCRTA